MTPSNYPDRCLDCSFLTVLQTLGMWPLHSLPAAIQPSSVAQSHHHMWRYMIPTDPRCPIDNRLRWVLILQLRLKLLL